ncbi:MAG TPA: beta-ketoacyl synthase chain length factor [Aquabacterium sp.]|nr:beta-ketoacyl synthase chain length factor [Aquabacterium sp.]
MSAWQVHVDGVGLYGPGMNGWAQAREVLTGRAVRESDALCLPVPQALPPAERRRVGLTLKLAMACGMEALAQAQADPAQVASVFSSSAGDCDNCHQILCALAEPERAVSPTRFHNSVHNMPAGYWSIATGCMAPSTSLAAYDATFAAGLLEAATQARCTGRPCLLIAFDTSYPEPLHTLRPIPHPFGAALLLSPQRSAQTLATLELALVDAPVSRMPDAALETMRAQVPAARGLPLLQALAAGAATEVALDYLGHRALQVGVRP